MDRIGSWHDWLHGQGSPGLGASPLVEQGHVTRQLATELVGGTGVLGLVLAHWLASWVPGWLAAGSGVLELVSACWWVRLVPDNAGCGIHGVLELVLACWVGGPGLFFFFNFIYLFIFGCVGSSFLCEGFL